MAGSATARGLSVMRREMRASDVLDHGVTRVLDCVSLDDGKMIAFFGAGTAPAAFLPDGAPGCARPQELRDVSGAAMVVTETVGSLALADGHSLTLAPHPAEPGLFDGLNTIFGFRLEESPTQVAEGLIYHALHHGLQAALIVIRLPDPAAPEAFADELRAALDGVDLTVVVLDCPIPLGKPGYGPENHPYMAPDAPGKDRMEVPAPDPWRAPLGEQLMFEIAKWRFLSAARAVLVLDVTDILPMDAPPAFDRCIEAKHGVVLLVGRRIYPWRVRPRGEARFGDHICQQFDARRGIARWGVAPAKAGLANTWRMVRVAYAKPDPAAVVPFLRAMAIRVPGRQSGELAPKTSLIEDPALVRMSKDVFGHSPIHPPISKPKPAPKAAAKGGRTAIVTTMKNEGPFILEWIAYHRAIGVDDFLVYTNDCTDGTDTMLELLQDKGLVQHRANPWVPGGELKPQHAALQAAESEPVIQNCGWGICMDVDEFINIKIGDGTLASLYAAMGEANMISLTWRLMGNSGEMAERVRQAPAERDVPQWLAQHAGDLWL